MLPVKRKKERTLKANRESWVTWKEVQEMLTLRKKIAEALKQESLDLREISKQFGIREKDALDHLHHIAKSTHSMGFTMEPPRCNHCGYSFKKRTRLNTPGHCPICKSESISPPRFQITGT